MDKQIPIIIGNMHLDETYHKIKKENVYRWNAKDKKQDKKIRFITDKLVHYKKGFNKYFSKVAEITHGVPIACRKYRLKYNNNCIERDHQYNKQRYKIMRGFKNLKSANEILNFFDVHYNFIDKQVINKKLQTPAEAAWINKNLGENYRLLKLIEIAYDED